MVGKGLQFHCKDDWDSEVAQYGHFFVGEPEDLSRLHQLALFTDSRVLLTEY